MRIETGKSPKLSKRIANSILEQIRSGEYPVGRRLPGARELAQRFSVSRVTMREAIIALESQGILESRRGAGSYVVEIAPAEPSPLEHYIDPIEVIEARRLFEGEAAALAAVTITDEELRKLESLLKTLTVNTTRETRERADRNFCIAIAEATQNSAIARAVQRLREMHYRSPEYMKMFERARDCGVQAWHDDYGAILSALRARNPHAARAAIRNHLDRVIYEMLNASEADALQRARCEGAAKREEMMKRTSI